MDQQSAMIQPVMAGGTLEERSPCFGWRAFWGNTLLTEIVLLLFPGALVLGATWPRWDGAAIGMASAALCVLPVALLCAWSQNRYLRGKSGSVTFSNGLLTTVVNSDMHSVPLDRCRWYYGNSTRATVPDLGYLPVVGVPAILIELPPEYQTDERNVRGKLVPRGPIVVAVGFVQESRREWLEVLAESAAVHDQQRQALPAPLSSLAKFCLAILALPACFIVGIYGSRVLDHMLIAWGIPQDIAMAISFPVFLPGCVYLVAYLFLFLSLRERRCALTVEQRRVAVEDWKLKARWFVVLAVMLFGIWTNNRLNLTGKVIETAINLLMTAFIILHLHILLRDPQAESAD